LATSTAAPQGRRVPGAVGALIRHFLRRWGKNRSSDAPARLANFSGEWQGGADHRLAADARIGLLRGSNRGGSPHWRGDARLGAGIQRGPERDR